jgi:hypothetical protein
LIRKIFSTSISDAAASAFIMFPMSNQSFLSVWCRDFSEETILERFGAFLATVPFSKARPGFTHLIVRAVDPAEWPVLEMDLRVAPFDAAGIVEVAKDQLHSDCSYEVNAAWDLWGWDGATDHWKLDPQPLEIFCRGEEYDNAIWRENGHIEVNLGFEHLFTGHAGLLGLHTEPQGAAESKEEARFLEAMAWPENLQRYQENTQENIRKLMDWMRQVEKAVPVERVRLWSEGEGDFEARLGEILAVR